MGNLLALEPRIMFDGAALVTGAEVVQDTTAQDQTIIPGIDGETNTDSNPNDTSDNDAFWASGLSLTAPSDRKEIIFIDTRVEDYQTLMEGIDLNAEVILLDSTRDGIEQIAETLSERSDIDAIHLIAEGNEAELHLGTSFLTQEVISGRYANLFTQIGQSLSADADLLIYGCNFGEGETGQEAMEALAELTGADIAASTDRTGHTTEYADWELEVATGTIESSIAIGETTQAAWEGVLATYTVTTTTDGGAGSLRQAIIDSNLNAGTDTITFTGSGTYLLTITGAAEAFAATGDLDINDDLILIGNGAGNTIIDASGFGGTPDRVFHIRGTNTATMSGITIQGGDHANGGGIFVDNTSTLNLSDAILTGNNHSGAGSGGAIHVHGTAHLTDVLLSGNTATRGGAIGYHGADGGSLTNVTITGNTSTGRGGGIWNDSVITVTNSTITGNSALGGFIGGGIFNDGTLTLIDTAISGNSAEWGAGIYNFDTMTLERVTIDGNMSNNSGAGIYNDFANTVSLTNVTISGNTSGNNGGGIYTHSSIDITNSTIASNSAIGTGGGINAVGGSGDAVLKNTILGNNVGGNANRQLTSLGNNIDSDGTALLGDPLDGMDPMLVALQDNGGFTKTHAFLAGSPVLNAGTAAGAPTVDQRGVTRDANVDIGAFEATSNLVSKSEFLVNTETTDQQTTDWSSRGSHQAVAISPNGNYVVVWSSNNQDGSGWGVYGQRFDQSGNPVGSEFPVTFETSNNQQFASVAMDNNQNFVVVWTSTSQDGNAEGVFARVFDWNLTPTTPTDIQVNSTTNGDQEKPSVAIDPDDGSFVVVWEGNGEEPGEIDPQGVFYRRFDATGAPIHPTEKLVDEDASNSQFDGAVAMNANGAYVVVFDDSDGFHFRLFDNTGTPVLQDVVDGSTFAGNGSVAMHTDGSFVVTWREGFGFTDIYAQRYDSGGMAIGPRISVNSSTALFQTEPSISMDGVGNFIIVWEGNGDQAGNVDASGVFGQEYFSNGNPIGGEFLINQTISGIQNKTSVAMLNPQNFVAVWSGEGPGDTDGVFARQFGTFTSPPMLDLDANDSSGATGNAYQFTFTEGNAPTAIADSDTDLVDGDSTTFDHVQLSVSGLLDGNAETLVLDGDTFALATAVAGQDTTGGNYHVVITTGAGTATLTLTKQGGGLFTEGETETLITAIQYQHTDTSAPTDGDRLIDVIVNDGTYDSAAARTTINVDPVNDAPTVDLDANDSSGATGNAYQFTFTEGDAPTAIADSDTDLVDGDSTTFASVKLAVTGLLDGNAETLVLDGDTFALATAVAGQDTTGGNYHVVIGTGAGTATVTLTKQGGGLFTEGETETLITAIQYQHTDTSAPTDGDRLIDVIVNDGTDDSVAARTTINVNPVNTAPTVDLDANDSSGATGNAYQFTFTEGNAPTAIADSDTDLVDGDSTTFDHVQLSVSGLLDGNAETLVLDGDTFALATAVAGQDTTGSNYHVVITTGAGTATLTITKQGGGLFTEGETETLITAMQYQHTDTSAPTDGDRLIDVIVNDGTDDSVAARTTINVNPVNTAPTVDLDANDSSGATGNAYQFTFTEGDAPTAIADSDTDLVDGDSTTFDHVQLSVSGLLDGNAETLIFDGDTFALATAVAGQDTTGGNYHVVIGTGAGTATLTITKQGGGLFTEGETETLITAMQYQHTDTSAPTDGDRLIDVIVNDGIDDSVAARTTINVNPVNAPPVAVADGFTVLEGSTTTLNLAGNDTDADDGLDLTSIRIISGPINGTINSINVNGTVDYTHDGSETLADSFTYTIDDLAGATSNTVTVSLTVTPQNDAPIITSNGGVASATVTVIEGNTAVTDVNAFDPEGSPLTYSLIGGADAALFSIDPTTGVLTFKTAPDSEAPGDVGGDNVYDVVVQVSDGTAADTQTIAVTVTQAPPVFIPPPPPDPTPDPTPPPSDDDGDDGESEDETSEDGVPVLTSSPGNLPGNGQDSPGDDSKDSDTENNLASNNSATMEQRTENTNALGNALDDILDILRKPFDRSAIKGEIEAILTRWGFLEDLDRVRDAFQDATATEQTYLASSVAASTGLSIGYVFWLLRSGVLLTALLSSLPAWQFVNPLLVLDSPEKKKRKKGQDDPEEDSVESMFEKHTVPAEPAETQTSSKVTEHESRWSSRTSL